MPFVVKQTDNSRSFAPLPAELELDLEPYAGATLNDLCARYDNFLIFPNSFLVNNDDIGKRFLFEIREHRLFTGNVLGFFGTNNAAISITSRFDASEDQFFLHYLLHKVAGINMVNLKTGSGEVALWDFLIYFFPLAIKEALQQGVFKTYRWQKYCDTRVKGRIDIFRQIAKNMPFSGKIPYDVRERSADNPIMQLVRHTIEFIRSSGERCPILSIDSGMRTIVLGIETMTSSYKRNERDKVIAENLRPLHHPYYSAYSFLQKICLQILRHEKISYGDRADKIFGIVFDASWLWEEYLATMLIPLGLTHPRNKTKEDPIFIYENSYSTPVYPDFLSQDIIVDAKYKKIDTSGISREDRYQIISYMHITKSLSGYLIYPTTDVHVPTNIEGTLNGYGGIIGTIPFHIPHANNPKDFWSQMQCEEELFISLCKDKMLKTTR